MIAKLTNVFTQEQIATMLNRIERVSTNEDMEQARYGRIHYEGIDVPSSMKHHMRVLVEEIDPDLMFSGASCVQYNAKYGKPDLPPHFDGDSMELIVDYQLDSNTSWGLGVDEEVYEIADNEAIAFHPNESIHWRPHKSFEDGDYVIMMFFRFKKRTSVERVDRRYSQNDPIFNDVKAVREKLRKSL